LWKVLGRHGLQRQELEEASVVDEDVEPAERLVGLCEEPPDVSFLRDIGVHRDGPATLARDLSCDALAAGLTRVVLDRHGGALS
jgi:hypothetical protein